MKSLKNKTKTRRRNTHKRRNDKSKQYGGTQMEDAYNELKDINLSSLVRAQQYLDDDLKDIIDLIIMELNYVIEQVKPKPVVTSPHTHAAPAARHRTRRRAASKNVR